MNRIFVLSSIAALSLCIIITALGEPPKNFSEAKKIIYRIYSEADHKRTFYCNCRYSKHKTVDLKSCGYIPRKNRRRAQRVEVEHIVPARVFGYSRRCWREPICRKKNGKHYKGRKCCERIDPVFRRMESDLHNLVPSIGEVNGDRRDYSFTHLGKTPFQYGSCPFVVDFELRKVEPPVYTRGFIARTYLYMNKTYGIPISNKQRKLFNLWNRKYRITDWEMSRNRKINNFVLNGR